MPGQEPEMAAGRGLTRRDFLTSGLRSRLAVVLGGSMAAATPSEGADAAVAVSPEDLRPMTRDAARAAVDRIGARGRTG